MDQGQRMPFFEVAGGKWAVRMQEAFEQAQNLAAARGVNVTINAKLVVMPPDRGEPQFGKVKATVALKSPAWETEYPTELRDGMIVRDGESIGDILQERLEFPELDQRRNGTGE